MPFGPTYCRRAALLPSMAARHVARAKKDSPIRGGRPAFVLGLLRAPERAPGGLNDSSRGGHSEPLPTAPAFFSFAPSSHTSAPLVCSSPPLSHSPHHRRAHSADLGPEKPPHLAAAPIGELPEGCAIGAVLPTPPSRMIRPKPKLDAAQGPSRAWCRNGELLKILI